MKEKKIPCEIYQRVVGYFRPLSQANKGIKAQIMDRRDMLTGEYIYKRNEES